MTGITIATVAMAGATTSSPERADHLEVGAPDVCRILESS